MAERIFQELLPEQNSQQRHVCVGLDTSISEVDKRIAAGLNLNLRAHATEAERVVAYNEMVIDATRDIAAAYKPNRAFYDALGVQGNWALKKTFESIRSMAPKAVGILDAKFGDIGNTNDPYVDYTFNFLKADAVTIHNFMGKKAMEPFLNCANKGIFILAKTSNEGSEEFQDLVVDPKFSMLPNYHLYEEIARNVAKSWNENHNCGLVAGATYPEQAARIRAIVGANLPLLIPGVGAQGQTAAEIVPMALRKMNAGYINSSRGITFAKPREGESFDIAISRSGYSLHDEIVLAQAA